MSLFKTFLNSQMNLSSSQLHTLLRKNTCGCNWNGCPFSQGMRIFFLHSTLLVQKGFLKCFKRAREHRSIKVQTYIRSISALVCRSQAQTLFEALCACWLPVRFGCKASARRPCLRRAAQDRTCSWSPSRSSNVLLTLPRQQSSLLP